MKASFGFRVLLVAAAIFVLGLASRSREYKTESASPPSVIDVPMPAAQDPRSTAEETELGEPEHSIPQRMPQAGPANADQGGNSEPSADTPGAAEVAPVTPGLGATHEVEKQATLPQVIRGGPTRRLKPHRGVGSM
jgi:hypothetical protein